MSWLGLLAGLVAVWVVTEVFGSRGIGLAMLGAAAGMAIGHLHKRLSASQALWQARVALLEAEVRALKPPALAPAAVEALPVTAPAPVAATPPPSQPVPIQRPAPASPASDETTLAVTSSLGQSLLAWVRGGNTIVRVAVLLLFIGVAFLLRYAAQNVVVPVPLRIAAVALGGVALAAVGWRLRDSRRTYGLTLQGGGIGIVYLSLFAAYRLDEWVPAGLAFALLAALAAITATLAVLQNALPLALFGFGGAFLAPVLASSQSGSHVALFSYDLLVNLAIAWIARRQAWKLLNLMGAVCTFTIAAAWGARAYTADHFASTEPFLVLHFLLYLFIAVQYTRLLVAANETRALTLPTVDGGLLFGVPVAAFGLQAAMLHDRPLALALSAALMSALYLAVGRWLWQVAGQRMLLLVEGLLALGVIFLALVTPLALEARWTGVAWALQGAGIVWVGLRQQRWWAAAMGLLMQAGATLSFWVPYALRAEPAAFFDSWQWGALVLAGAALASAHFLWRYLCRSNQSRPAATAAHWVMLVLGLLQAALGLWDPLATLSLGTLALLPRGCALLAVFTLALELAQRPLQWPPLRQCARALLLAALALSAAAVVARLGAADALWHHLTAGGAIWVALVLLVLGVALQRRLGTDTHAVEPAALAWFAMLHAGLFAYALGAHFVVRHAGWTPAAAIAGPTAVALWLVARGRADPARWPMDRHGEALSQAVLQPWLGLLMLWVLAVNAGSDASMAPLPYLPLLNPLDLGHGLVLLYALALARLAALPQPAVALAGGALAFWWLNGLLVRTLHHWADTPMWSRGALQSELVQTGLSMLWTLSACSAMWVATRRAQRLLWMAGAVLLGAVVLKLFLVDLSKVGTLARIVSFLGVGGLMLVIGYVAPLPPAARQPRPGAPA